MSELKLERISHPDAAGTSIELAASGAVSFSNDIAFNTDTFFVDTANGRVGIGTTSPDQTLHVHKGSAGTVTSQALSVLTLENNTTAILQFLTPATSSAQIRFGDPSDNGAGYIDYSHSSNVLSFGVNGPEKMRIDSSGNLLVGKTASDGNATAGHEFRPAGYSYHAADSSAVGIFNRFTNDGDVLTIRKDSANTGRIGVEGGDLTIESTQANHAGLRFAGGSVLPRYNGSLADNAVDLGQVSTNYRFKDLYLAGGVYVGGTGAANYLDDYEEGSITSVTISGTTSGSGSVVADGYYTKVGGLVHVVIRVDNKSFPTFSGVLRVSLPFTVKNATCNPRGSDVYYYPQANWDSSSNFAGMVPIGVANTAQLQFGIKTVDGDRQAAITNSNSNLSGQNNLYFSITLTYRTDS